MTITQYNDCAQGKIYYEFKNKSSIEARNGNCEIGREDIHENH